MKKTPLEVLESWDRRALKSLDAHYESGRGYARLNLVIGVPTVMLAAVISVLAFATMANGASFKVQLLIGLLGLIQAILAALHTWFRHSELAEKHRYAGARYAAIRRQIEQLSAYHKVPEPAAMSAIREALDAVALEAPSIPPKRWYNTQIAFGGHGTADGTVLVPEAAEDVQTNTQQDAKQ